METNIGSNSNDEQSIDAITSGHFIGVRGKNKKGRLVRRLVITASSLLLLILLAILGVSYAVGNTLIHPQRNMQYLNLNPAQFHIPYQNVTFYSRRDHTRLDGWEMKTARSQHQWVIISHGYAANRLIFNQETFQLYSLFLQHGYNVATFDYSDSGRSGGTTATVGAWEQEDLLGTMDDLVAQDAQARIGLYGISQGAAVSVMAASQNPHTSFVIADSPYADLDSFLSQNLPFWSHLPNFPFTPLILTLLQAQIHVDINSVSPIKALAHFNGPILLTHSRADQSIPVANSRLIYQTYKDNKDITYREFATSPHAHEFMNEHKAYVAVLDAFLNHVASLSLQHVS